MFITDTNWIYWVLGNGSNIILRYLYSKNTKETYEENFLYVDDISFSW